MKNLNYVFNPYAKTTTRHQSGFQPIARFSPVSKWEYLSEVKNAGRQPDHSGSPCVSWFLVHEAYVLE